MRIALAAVAVIGVLSGVATPTMPAPWRVATIPADQLVALADTIVIAKVSAIESKADDLRVATATVAEVWKGKPGSKVTYRASGTWTCDTSTAKVGELVVLFLRQQPDGNQLEIAHSGRGRLPIVEVDSKQFAESLVHGVRWPESVLPPPPSPGMRSLMALPTLKDFVAATCKVQSATDAR